MIKYLYPIVLYACSSKTSNNQDDQVILDQDSLSDQDPFFSDSDLPNIMDELDPTYCDATAAEYPNVPGATSYFVGSYIQSDTEWIGREKWILFPNESWQNAAYQQWIDGDEEMADIAQGYPCEISWDMRVEELEELETCLACTLAFYVQADISTSSTSCPQGLWSDPAEQNWETIYEIANANGSSIFYFRSNGNPFGWGYASDQALNFLSEPSCKWF